MEKLLITGASGVIGKVLAPKLAESHDVYSVDQNLTAVPGRLFKQTCPITNKSQV